ncbi:MAG: LD-carboxypeptidase [Syntrophomonadaceae bacterium]|nr:LD-carboxypeptidase [Dysgonamonadaceae bacterium]MDD3901435.1 LD-carboxypeptidase [Dysgonamonadaceae bacterium]MDD4550301.1 LD-carboxypeptidase [Syntrophomonadaceae bacterium]
MNKQIATLPRHLKKDDKVNVLVLSAPDGFNFKNQFLNGVDCLKGYGLKVQYSDECFASAGYTVSSPEKQAQALNNAFSDHSIKGIFLAGGGYNLNRVLPFIDFDLIKSNPKVIIGMSNMSVLLNAILAKTGLASYYGPAVIHNLGNPEGFDEYSKQSFRKTLFENSLIGEITPFSKWKTLNSGIAEGKIVGGNLTSIESLIGTEYEPDWTESILFWEDCFMELHTLDMILTHFMLAGIFTKIKGMVIGRPLEIQEEEMACDLNFEDIITDICGKLNIPVMYNVDFGHNDEKFTLPIGVEVTIDCDNTKISLDRQHIK